MTIQRERLLTHYTRWNSFVRPAAVIGRRHENDFFSFISNLLQEMRRKGVIRPVGGKRGKGAQWELYKPPAEG